ncbi:MAG TPA: phosphoenolpyruvate--protein phosphotransferase [Candidatus Aminicenantes bacterium]|nr:phosphoenolpyruvate--protein phosphotransferase [Candidatus Aminicenantes bacterium]
MEFIRLRGVGVSPGIAMGVASLPERVVFTQRREVIPASIIDDELRRVKRAIDRTRNELIEIKEAIGEKMGEEHAFIFDAHLLILDDKSLLASLEKTIREEKVRAEWAISKVNARYEKVFESINDEYFRQRKSDISDVLAKVYRNLERRKEKKEEEGQDKVLVAHDLLPSEAATAFGRQNILAVALDMGGPTSHTAILARSLNIPAVLGLHDVTLRVKNGDYLIIDGTDGEVIVNPPPAIKREFLSKKEKYDAYRQELQKTAKLKSQTLDGVRFYPMANIELPEEVKTAFSLGAEGVGLFRSEFIYLQSPSIPSEEDHLAVYSRIAREAHPAPVYIRTIDIGGEKSLPQLNIEKEPNPALGLRAIRFSLRNVEMFKIQLRAILRASLKKNVRILIPMITEIEEITEVKMLFRQVKDELRRSKIKFDEKTPLGIMIEVPAAAAMIDQLIKEVDYVSIGTNDLIQYYLAVDRSNEYVSYLFKPLHPAVLRLLKSIIQAGAREGKDVTVCGEMAADPLSALALLGLGLRKFSMNPIFIPRIKKALRAVEVGTVEAAVNEALNLKSAQEIEELIIEKILVRHLAAFLTRRPS